MPALGFIVGGVITELSSPRAAYGISAVGVALIVIAFTLRPIDRVQLEPVGAPKVPVIPGKRSAEAHETEPTALSVTNTTVR
jgi:hypothetical protein